jgi:phage gp46-like protein
VHARARRRVWYRAGRWVAVPDFRTAWNPATAPWAADWLMDSPGLATDRDLETAVILSLFTDASARADDVIPDMTDDRRGWWANSGPVGDQPAPPEGAMGSRLWLLAREKATDQTRQRACQYAGEALAWLTADGVAARVDVRAAWLDAPGTPPGALGMQIRILRQDGTTYDMRYAWAWDQFLPSERPVPRLPSIPAVWNKGRWNLDTWTGQASLAWWNKGHWTKDTWET